MVELDIRRCCYAYALEHLYVFQNQIMHQILYVFVFYIRVCERYFLATVTMLFQFLVCKHVAYRPRASVRSRGKNVDSSLKLNPLCRGKNYDAST